MPTPRIISPKSEERIDVRLSGEAKELIEHAAAIEGISVSAFVVGNALFNARQVVAEHDTWKLNRRDSKAFVEALLNPPKPNAALQAAYDRHETGRTTDYLPDTDSFDDDR